TLPLVKSDSLPGLPSPVTSLIVRFRGLVIVLWALIAAVGFTRARHTPELLNVRGGGGHETEAARADRLLATQFDRPFSEFFAVVLESTSPFSEPMAHAALDSIASELRSEPYVRS